MSQTSRLRFTFLCDKGENGRTPRKIAWHTCKQRTWLVSHVASVGLEPFRDFALAREIIDDHENKYFSIFLLDHEDFFSCKSVMSFYNDFENSK